MDLLKQAFSELERTVEKTVTEAASAVVESASQYPKPASESARAVKQLHLSAKAVAQQLQDAERSWDDYYWQVGCQYQCFLQTDTCWSRMLAVSISAYRAFQGPQQRHGRWYDDNTPAKPDAKHVACLYLSLFAGTPSSLASSSAAAAGSQQSAVCS